MALSMCRQSYEPLSIFRVTGPPRPQLPTVVIKSSKSLNCPPLPIVKVPWNRELQPEMLVVAVSLAGRSSAALLGSEVQTFTWLEPETAVK